VTLCMDRILSLAALIGLCVVSSWAIMPPANILIVAGSDGIAQTAGSVLNTELTTAGNTVTVVNTGVPGSLAGFTQIYDTRYNNLPAFTAGEMSQYLAFLQAAPGNTIFLMGENNFFNARNTPINSFIALAGGGTIAAPSSFSSNSETVNPPFTGPNTISTVKFAACGVVTSAGNGAFASSETGGGCSLFFGTGALQNARQSALVVVYDVNFIATAPTSGAVNEIAFRKNLEQFVSAPTPAPPAGTIPPPAAAPAPTLSTWGQIILALALIGIGAVAGRRRTFA
jgi:hypothetical protein